MLNSVLDPSCAPALVEAFVGDGPVLLASLLGIAALVAVAEGLRVLGLPAAATRRGVHAGVCLFVAASPWLFSGSGPLCVLAAIFVFVNGTAQARGWWPGVHAARPDSWGTVAMPLAVLPAVAATWGVVAERIVLFQVAFLVLGLADPLAAWVGDRYGRCSLTDAATLEGTVAFFGTTALLVGGTLAGTGWPPSRILSAVVATAAVAATVEAVSRRGWDNLFVVLSVLGVLAPLQTGSLTPTGLLVAGGAGVGFGVLAYGAGALDGSGAVGGGLFAATLVGLGGHEWVAPGLAFVVLASALSALPETGEEGGSVEDRTPGRTLRQVLANGGVAWGLLLTFALAPPAAPGLRAGCYAGFLGALAAAAADTWATEIGTRYGGPPWSLATLARVPPGTSGAVTLFGTAAAALGAGTVALAALLTAPGPFGSALGIGPPTVGAGLAGMAVDSLAGATIQAQYRTEAHGAIAERPPDPEAPPLRGWAGVDNDLVNVLGTTGGALVSTLFWTI